MTTLPLAARAGLGLHLLAMPAVEAYERLGYLLGPANTSCGAALRGFVQPLLRPVAQAVARRFIATNYNASAGSGNGNVTAPPNNVGAAMNASLALAGVNVTANAASLPPAQDGFQGATSPQDPFLFNLTVSRFMWTAAMLDAQVTSERRGVWWPCRAPWPEPHYAPSFLRRGAMPRASGSALRLRLAEKAAPQWCVMRCALLLIVLGRRWRP